MLNYRGYEKDKERKELLEELKELKQQKMLTFIYDVFKKSDFKDERLLRHINYKSDAEYLGDIEMLMFLKELPKKDKKYDNEDYLVMFRFNSSENLDNWDIINFHGTDLSSNLSKDMINILMNSIQNG